MSSRSEPNARVRITVSDWAKRALDGLAEAKAYPVGILYTTALELGVADIVAHFKALEAITPKGLDASSLGAVLPGVDVERARRRANAENRRKSKLEGREYGHR